MKKKKTGLRDKARKVRDWLDGVEQPPPSQADQFIVAIAREIGQVMQKEKFTPPGEPTYIPRDYIVFLSKKDYDDWRGQKREGLKRGLLNALSAQASELVGQQQFQTPSIAIALRVDGTLDAGKFYVRPIWDPNAEKTVESKQPKSSPNASPLDEDTELNTLMRRFTLRIEKRDRTGRVLTTEERPVRSWKINIGRKTGRKKVGEFDLLLPDDLPDDREVSRDQATLTRNEDHSYTLECRGKSPIWLANGSTLSEGESAVIKAGDTFRIVSYHITILSDSPDKEHTGDSSLA